MRTPASFSVVRCTHPVVLPRPFPSVVVLRCSRWISRLTCGFTFVPRPPRSFSGSVIPHRSIHSSSGSFCWWSRNSLMSKPMPPAPITATRSPTGACPRTTSSYRTTLMVDALDRRDAGQHAGRDDDLVIAGQCRHVWLGAQMQVDFADLDLTLVVGEGAIEVLLAGD